MHVAVAGHLRDDRGGGDRGALLVAVDDRAVRRRQGPELEAVDEARLRRLAGPERLPQAAQVRAMETVPVDHRRREDPNRDPRRAAENHPVELLAPRRVDLLRVVQERERPDLVVAKALEVEQHAGDDERPCERPAPRLVGPGDEADAEAPIEARAACVRCASS